MKHTIAIVLIQLSLVSFGQDINQLASDMNVVYNSPEGQMLFSGDSISNSKDKVTKDSEISCVIESISGSNQYAPAAFRVRVYRIDGKVKDIYEEKGTKLKLDKILDKAEKYERIEIEVIEIEDLKEKENVKLYRELMDDWLAKGRFSPFILHVK
jgi:hypothetical protein